jgi:hypothetical protein
MADVYVVLQGEYSDRRIVAVFSEEVTARRVAEGLQGDVETWALDPAFLLPTLPRYLVRLHRETGEVLACMETVALQRDTFQPYRSVMYELTWWPQWQHAFILTVYCYARTPEHALKIAQDLHAEITAQNYWRFLGTYRHAHILTDEDIQEALAEEAQGLLHTEEGV